jgi:hypothetical protein
MPERVLMVVMLSVAAVALVVVLAILLIGTAVLVGLGMPH